MFSFSKRKLKGGEVGLGFFDSVRKARLAGYPETEELFPQDAEIGLEAVKDEWLYLEIFRLHQQASRSWRESFSCNDVCGALW